MNKFWIFIFLGILYLPFTATAEEDLNLRKNVVIIFDDSGSMGSIFWKSKLDQAKESVVQLIQGIPDDYNFGIYALNHGYIVQLQNIMGKKQDAINSVNQLKAGGGTPIGPAILAVKQYLDQQKQSQGGYGFYTIVVVTDGAADKEERMLNAVDEAIASGINIKTIGFGITRHKLMQVTDFADASSTQQLTNALKQAIKAEVPGSSEFVVQDF